MNNYLQLQTYDTVNISIIDTDMENHWGVAHKQKQWLDELTKATNLADKDDLIIWPEAAFPYFVTDDDELKTLMHRLFGERNLVFGADRLRYLDNGNFEIYNSMFVLSATNTITRYDKILLVPFGEYIPFSNILPSFLQKIAYGLLEDFTPGRASNLLTIKGLTFVPAICYESAFTSFVSQFDVQDSDFIINIANDRWFGDSIGLKRNLISNQIRAIEYGKFIVRSANSGISGIINPLGILEQPVMVVHANKSKILKYVVQLKSIVY